VDFVSGSKFGNRAVVLGNGFIGSAAALAMIEDFQSVRMIARRPHQLDSQLIAKGIEVEYFETPESYWRRSSDVAEESDVLVAAIGTASPSFVETNYSQELDGAMLTAERVTGLLAKNPQLRSIHVSSGGCVYGESPFSGSVESDATSPRGNYGLLHVQVEDFFSEASAKNGDRSIVVRVSNPYGPAQVFNRGQGFVAYAAQQIRGNQPVTLLADGDQVRDFVHIDDVGSSIALLAKSSKAKGIFNIGTALGTSNRKVGELISQILDTAVTFTSAPSRSFDVQQNILNNSRITSEVGITFMPLEKGLKKALYPSA
jgi:UDP-glucose 4-epimerase